MKKHKLQQVFVATDADGEGTDTIKKTEKSKTIMYTLFKDSLRPFFWFIYRIKATLPINQSCVMIDRIFHKKKNFLNLILFSTK